jgi:hypothetical protein
MANRVFLMLNLSGDPNEEYASEAVAAGASYCYPVLWWSLFSCADIVLRTEDWEDDEGNSVPVSFPCPITTLTAARKRAVVRQRLFFSYFPQTVEPIYQQWLTLLEGIDAPYLQINTGEVWGMSEPERSNAEITTYVRAFENGHVTDWIALLKQMHIEWNPAMRQIAYRSLDRHYRDLTEAEAEIGYRLRGYEWERPVPWQDDCLGK